MQRYDVIKAAVIAGLSVALWSGEASAACLQWDVGGNWQILQSNGFATNVALRQNGANVIGNANYRTRATSGRMGASESGEVDGTIKGNAINLSIYWGIDKVGVYFGSVGPTGRIEGTTYDKRYPTRRAAWHSSARMKCLRSR